MSVVKLSDENEWIAILEVPIYDNHGREITYEWREVEVPGYHVESTYDIDVVTTITNRIFELPNVPEDQPQPVNVGKYTQLIDIDEYGTALGGEILINHAGDCFD